MTIRGFLWLFVLAGCLILTDCATSRKVPSDVYYNMGNWYVRQNATPRYFAPFDVFYMAPEAFHTKEVSVEDIEYAKQVTVEKFGKNARVFAPVCHDAKDCKAAFKWYLENYHGENGRPFVFIGEGDGAKMLAPLVEDAKEEGLVEAYFRPEDLEGDFITQEFADAVCGKVRDYLLDLSWKQAQKPE